MPRSVFRSSRRLGVGVLLATCFLAGCALDGRAVGVGAQGGAAAGTAGRGGTTNGPRPGSGGLNAGGSAGDSGMMTGIAGTASVGGRDGLGGSGGSDGSAGVDGSAGSSAPDAGTDPPDPVLPSCATQSLSGIGSVTATTTAGDGSFSLSCGGSGADDIGIHWVAPETGYYSIDTLGSSFDTVLGVVAASCDGTELACDDDGAQAPASEVLREFAAGEEVVFVVDGKSGDFGDVVLNTHRVTCPVIDTKRQDLPLASTTLQGTNSHGGDCGGDGQLEQTFRWQAPQSGLFRFTASSDAMAPALYVERGPRCGGELLGCNTGGFSGPAVVVRRLDEGDEVTLIVEGTDGAGAFELNVEDISENVCPDHAEPILFDDTSDSGVLSAGDPSVLTGSCVPARQRILPGGEFDLPEHTYPLTIEDAFCNVLISADGPVAVYILDGLSCGGAELTCQVFDSPDFEEVEPSIGDIGVGPQSFVIVVESASPVTNDISYTFDFLCAIP
jgi:hypothetical protein